MMRRASLMLYKYLGPKMPQLGGAQNRKWSATIVDIEGLLEACFAPAMTRNRLSVDDETVPDTVCSDLWAPNVTGEQVGNGGLALYISMMPSPVFPSRLERY